MANIMANDTVCFARRNMILPVGRGSFNERASALSGECTVLTCDCPGALECPFYKTKARLEADKQRAFERINSLPEYRQLGISIKYYGGQMPWRTAEG